MGTIGKPGFFCLGMLVFTRNTVQSAIFTKARACLFKEKGNLIRDALPTQRFNPLQVAYARLRAGFAAGGDLFNLPSGERMGYIDRL